MVKMPHWPIPIGNKPIDLDLSRIKTLLKKLGNPHLKLPPVIHVAGTNGKGSTTAFLKSIFQTAGYKVHTYTSPHLVKFNERIGICGTDISDQFLYEVIEECRIAAEKIDLQLTFFEGTTAAAFLAFSKVKADILILEVGLGGRLDATNVIDNPLMSIITSISFDHTEFLGNSLTTIAFEKAGIIKPNCPCVISAQYEQAMNPLIMMSEKNHSPSYVYEYDWIVQPLNQHQFTYKLQGRDYIFPRPNLHGDHQLINAGNAITAALNTKGFNITEEHIAHGITNAVWPARLQKLIEGNIIKKIPKTLEIWVDGAHNEGGAHVLSVWLEEQEQLEKLQTYMIFGMTKGRDCQKFLSSFTGKIKHIAGVLIEAEPSSYRGEYIRDEAIKAGFSASAHDSIDEALAHIIAMEKGKARIIVCGSLYLAGDILNQNQGFAVRPSV